MKITNIVLCLLVVIVTGCTTIGQQITNRDGVVQVQQHQSPTTATTSNQTKPSKTKTSTNNITKVSIPNPEQEILVEITESVISRHYVL